MKIAASVVFTLFAGVLAAPSVLAIPIQQAGSATNTSSGAPSGPKRPGPILHPSTSEVISEAGGQHRPIPASINQTLSAEN